MDERVAYGKKSVFTVWLLLCFATGPVSSMSRTYIPAVLQTMAHSLGKTAAGEACKARGNDCFINIGVISLHSNSYVLYVKAFYTILESIIALFVMNIGDYSNYKKWILCVSIVFYGALVTPFVGFTDRHSYGQLVSMTVLYSLANITNTIIQIIEAAYIPYFMRSIDFKAVDDDQDDTNHEYVPPEQVRRDMMMKKGSKVSALGLVLGNLGGITALLIGIIITYSHPSRSVNDSYDSFLLAITIAGSCTAVFGFLIMFKIPSVKEVKQPQGFLVYLSVKRLWTLVKEMRKYRNAFIFAMGWVVWNLTFSNFMSVFVLLFRSTLGIGASDKQYVIYTWMSYVLASLGSLCWMWLYLKTNIKMKTWAYMFLTIALLVQFWGCLGISDNTKVGLKHGWEFWVIEVLYSSTSSGLRSLNRVLYSTMLPKGDEVQYFGVVIVLGVMVNWAVDFLVALIQDRTGNDRYPFLFNLFLVVLSIFLYKLCDTERGMDTVSDLGDLETEPDEHRDSSTTVNTSFSTKTISK